MKHTCINLLLLLFFLFSTPTFLLGQLPDFEVGLLDLEKAPNFFASYEKHLVIGDKMFYVLGVSPKDALYCKTTDGSPAKLLFKADDFKLIGALGEKLIFHLRDEKEIYISDGTADGTIKLYTYGDSNLREYYNVGDKMVFLHYKEIYVTDGTPDGTMSLGTFDEVSHSSTDNYVLDNKLVFYANDGIYGRELWTTDGTIEGTARITDLAPGDRDLSFTSDIFPAAGYLFFDFS